MQRILRHLFFGSWTVRRTFPASAMRAIETAIRDGEKTHTGQVRFAVEAAFDIGQLVGGHGVAGRALELFSQLRVWDTAQNNGVLIYLLLAEHDVEIVADRGIDVHVRREGWEAICRRMEREFLQERFEQGVITGIRAVSGELQRHFPGPSLGSNELPDAPVTLR